MFRPSDGHHQVVHSTVYFRVHNLMMATWGPKHVVVNSIPLTLSNYIFSCVYDCCSHLFLHPNFYLWPRPRKKCCNVDNGSHGALHLPRKATNRFGRLDRVAICNVPAGKRTDGGSRLLCTRTILVRAPKLWWCRINLRQCKTGTARMP